VKTHRNTMTVEAKSMTAVSTALVKRAVAAPPTVFYSHKVNAQIRHLVDTAPGEISWVGLVSRIGIHFMVDEIFVPEQTVGATFTDITPSGLAKIALLLDDRGMDTSNLIYWGHSHVNMGVSPSGTDEEQVEEFLEHNNIFIRGIYNKRRESKVDVFLKEDNIVHQCVSNGTMVYTLSPEELATIDSVVKDNVSARQYNAKNSYVAPFMPHESNANRHHPGHNQQTLQLQQRAAQKVIGSSIFGGVYDTDDEDEANNLHFGNYDTFSNK